MMTLYIIIAAASWAASTSLAIRGAHEFEGKVLVKIGAVLILGVFSALWPITAFLMLMMVVRDRALR